MRSTLQLGVAAVLLAIASTPITANADTGYAAVWRPGGGTQWWRSGMTFDDMVAQDTIHFNNGLRIKSLVIREDRFTALWQQGGGTQWWRAGMTFDEMIAQDQIHFNNGLRISAIEVVDGRFAAVWQTGEGAQWWRAGMTFDDMVAQDQIHFNNGLRIAAIEIDNGLFTAVWRPGAGAQWWRTGMTVDEVVAQDTTYFGEGLRLSAMEITGDRYTAVWQPGDGAQWWASGRCFTDMASQDTALFAQGLRLGFVETLGLAGGAYHYPWKGGDSQTVPQGNNNAAGSHNGSQSFAFDFGLPAGTEIRAASGGTVEWLQEGLTATFDPSQPVSPTNTPFPNGSLDNWGNAVRIRHWGGFTSWYFHIQNNGVTVNVGDVVQGGQPIAFSGNTGRSSGPHLHFQVQADSVDWGQSVSISFGNCETPAGGSTVTSGNHNPNFP